MWRIHKFIIMCHVILGHLDKIRTKRRENERYAVFNSHNTNCIKCSLTTSQSKESEKHDKLNIVCVLFVCPFGITQAFEMWSKENDKLESCVSIGSHAGDFMRERGQWKSQNPYEIWIKRGFFLLLRYKIRPDSPREKFSPMIAHVYLPKNNAIQELSVLQIQIHFWNSAPIQS